MLTINLSEWEPYLEFLSDRSAKRLIELSNFSIREDTLAECLEDLLRIVKEAYMNAFRRYLSGDIDALNRIM